jgi:metal-responsive CopG/Arc/MetJ family transcriptional regulator
MASVKTAISLDADLLERIDAAAREGAMPRSRLLAEAAEEYLRRRENARLLAQLDRVYGADAGEEEAELRRRWRPLYRRVVEGEW